MALVRADGVWKTPRYKDARIGVSGVRREAGTRISEMFLAPPTTVRFFVWEFRPRFTLNYPVSRQRFERVSFDLLGDVQRVFTDPGEDEEDRGRQSLDYLIALARSRLLARTRARRLA